MTLRDPESINQIENDSLFQWWKWIYRQIFFCYRKTQSINFITKINWMQYKIMAGIFGNRIGLQYEKISIFLKFSEWCGYACIPILHATSKEARNVCIDFESHSNWSINSNGPVSRTWLCHSNTSSLYLKCIYWKWNKINALKFKIIPFDYSSQRQFTVFLMCIPNWCKKSSNIFLDFTMFLLTSYFQPHISMKYILFDTKVSGLIFLLLS